MRKPVARPGLRRWLRLMIVIVAAASAAPAWGGVPQPVRAEAGRAAQPRPSKVPLAGQSVPAPTSLKATGYVDDFAHVLPADQAAGLERQAAQLDQQLRVQVAMVTLPTTGNTDVFDYSLALAQHWGVGRKQAANNQDKDTGILIFLAVQDHKYYTQIGYGLEPYITDADAGTWMRGLVPELRRADYGAVFSGMLDQIERTLAARMPGASGLLAQLPAQPRREPAQDNGGGAGGLIWIGFFLLIWILGSLGTRGRGGMSGCWWPLIFMNMGGGGGYRGGGWGGGGGFGGGGFGGFGGGGFGGGGAGGSW